jgi:signal peptidase II
MKPSKEKLSMGSRFKLMAPIVATVFALDQITKYLIKSYVDFSDRITIVPGFFEIVHVRNRGAAFGFLSTLPENIRLPFFYVISFLALALIAVYFLKLKDPRRGVYICLALILGGAIGNIWDRITMGEVVDFLRFHWNERYVNWTLGRHALIFKLEWPSFNVADAAITTAVVWLMVLMAQEPKKQGRL